METYFWVIGTLKIDNDTRNKVNKTLNNVQLSKSLIRQVENGYIVG